MRTYVPAAERWTQLFETKSISELEALEPEKGVYGHFLAIWHDTRDAVLETKRRAVARAEQEAREREELAGPREAIVNLLKARADQLATMPAPAPPPAPPQGDATATLERQLNSSAAMVEEIARQILHEDCSVGATSDFMRSVSLLMSASASVGKVVSQLRGGGVTKTHHLVTVEQVGRGGRGSETLQTNGA